MKGEVEEKNQERGSEDKGRKNASSSLPLFNVSALRGVFIIFSTQYIVINNSTKDY